MKALREEFVVKILAVLTEWIEKHDRLPEAMEAFKMCIDAGMPDGTRAELVAAMRRYIEIEENRPANDE